MSAFKDAILKDVQNVFFNLDEFAERHNLNGREVICIVDDDVTEAAKVTVGAPLEGVFVDALNIYVKPGDLERRPVEGEVFYLDDNMYFVRWVSSEDGILIITLKVHNQ